MQVFDHRCTIHRTASGNENTLGEPVQAVADPPLASGVWCRYVVGKVNERDGVSGDLLQVEKLTMMFLKTQDVKNNDVVSLIVNSGDGASVVDGKFEIVSSKPQRTRYSGVSHIRAELKEI